RRAPVAPERDAPRFVDDEIVHHLVVPDQCSVKRDGSHGLSTRSTPRASSIIRAAAAAVLAFPAAPRVGASHTRPGQSVIDGKTCVNRNSTAELHRWSLLSPFDTTTSWWRGTTKIH